MRLLLAAFGFLLLAFGASPALAQGCGTNNPNCIVPTAPFGTDNDQAASTAFVQTAVSGVTTSVEIVGGSGITATGTCTGTTVDCTINSTWTASGSGGVNIANNNTGTVTIGNGVLNHGSIDNYTIDNTSIGQTTPNVATFTTGQATSYFETDNEYTGNAYYNAGWLYQASGPAFIVSNDNIDLGRISFDYAASGSAAGSITWNQGLLIDYANNYIGLMQNTGIKTIAPTASLDVAGGAPRFRSLTSCNFEVTDSNGNMSCGTNLTVTGTATIALNPTGTIAGSMCQTAAGLLLYEVGVNCFAASATSITINSTGVASSTANYVLYSDGTKLQQYDVTGTVSVGGCCAVLSVAPTITGHPTIEGVTSTGATGTGNFVFASSPTLSGTVGGNLIFSGTITLDSTLTAASLSTSGTIAGSLCQTSTGLVLYEAGVNCFSASAAAITIGSTDVNSSTAGHVLYSDGTLLQQYSITGTAGSVVMSSTPTITTPIITTSATLNNASIATTSSDGFILNNATAATSGAPQQFSPRLRLTGYGWKTASTASSQETDWIMENQPQEGTAAASTNLVTSYQVAGGGYTAASMLVSGGAEPGLTELMGLYGIADLRLPVFGGITCSDNTSSGVRNAVQAAIAAGYSRVFLPAHCWYFPNYVTNSAYSGSQPLIPDSNVPLEIFGENWETSVISVMNPTTNVTDNMYTANNVILHNVGIVAYGCYNNGNGGTPFIKICPLHEYVNNYGEIDGIEVYPFLEFLGGSGQTNAPVPGGGSPHTVFDVPMIALNQGSAGDGLFGATTNTGQSINLFTAWNGSNPLFSKTYDTGVQIANGMGDTSSSQHHGIDISEYGTNSANANGSIVLHRYANGAHLIDLGDISGSASTTREINMSYTDKMDGQFFYAENSYAGFSGDYIRLNQIGTGFSGNFLNFYTPGGQAFTVNAAGAVASTSNGSFGGTLSVTGTSTLTGNVSLGGTLGVTGAATLSNTLGVTGNVSLGGTLGVTGAATLSNTLGVTGAASLASTLSVTGNTTISGLTGLQTSVISGNTASLFIGGDVNFTSANHIFSANLYYSSGWQCNASGGAGYFKIGANTTVAATIGGPTTTNCTGPGANTSVTDLFTFTTTEQWNCTLSTNSLGVVQCVSDARLKDDHGPFTDGFDAVMNIEPRLYSFKEGTPYYDGGVVNAGFMAQTIQPWLPKAVHENSRGELELDQRVLTVALWNALRHEHADVERLEQRIETIENRMR